MRFKKTALVLLSAAVFSRPVSLFAGCDKIVWEEADAAGTNVSIGQGFQCNTMYYFLSFRTWSARVLISSYGSSYPGYSDEECTGEVTIEAPKHWSKNASAKYNGCGVGISAYGWCLDPETYEVTGSHCPDAERAIVPDGAIKDLANGAMEIIDRKCEVTDPCGGRKIPLPSGFQILSPGPDQVATPVLGTSITSIAPLAIGPMATNSDYNRLDYQIGLCPFEGPVDVYFVIHDPQEPFGLYSLDQDRKPRFAFTQLTPLLRGVSGKLEMQVSSLESNLFGSTHPISKGDHTAYLAVTPQNSNPTVNSYTWGAGAEIKCEGEMPVPTGREFFSYPTQATVITGTDPNQIRPLAVGPYAMDPNFPYINLHYDFCPFEGPVDVHVAIYCPEDDLFNVYFLVEKPTPQTSPEDVFEIVGIAQAITKFPAFCKDEDARFDESWAAGQGFAFWMNLQQWGLPAPFWMPSEVPRTTCYYMVAVTPKGIRDKFYAWVTWLDLNMVEPMFWFNADAED